MNPAPEKGDLAVSTKQEIVKRSDTTFIRGLELATAIADGAIFIAIKRGEANTVRKILAADRTRANKPNEHGETPLHLVDLYPNDKIRDLLLANDAEIPDRGWTELHLACFSGNLAKVDRHLIAGAEVNAKNKSGRSPLHLAVWYADMWAEGIDKTAIISTLLAFNADIHARDRDGFSPMEATWIQLRKSGEAIRKLLEKHGANDDHQVEMICALLRASPAHQEAVLADVRKARGAKK